MNAVLAIVHFAIVTMIGVIWFFRLKDPFLKAVFWPGFVLKIIAGVSLGLLFIHYYGAGDTLRYWQYLIAPDDLKSSILNVQVEPRVFYFLKPLEYLAQVTGKNYYVYSVYLSLFSFWGAFTLLRVLLVHFPRWKWGLTIGLLFWPSIVFWSSGLNKEAMAVGLLFLMIATVVNLVKYGDNLIFRGVFLIVGTVYLALLKYYYAGAFLGVGAAFMIASLLVKTYSLKWVLVFVVVLFVGLVLGSLIHPNLNFQALASTLEQNNRDMLHASEAYKARLPGLVNDKPSNWVNQAPMGLFHGIFSPLPWKAWNVLSMLSAVENFVLLLLSPLLFVRLFIKRPIEGIQEITAILVFILLSATVIGLATPNYGTMVRYKVSYLPFLVAVLMGSFFHLFGKDRKTSPINKKQ